MHIQRYMMFGLSRELLRVANDADDDFLLWNCLFRLFVWSNSSSTMTNSSQRAICQIYWRWRKGKIHSENVIGNWEWKSNKLQLWINVYWNQWTNEKDETPTSFRIGKMKTLAPNHNAKINKISIAVFLMDWLFRFIVSAQELSQFYIEKESTACSALAVQYFFLCFVFCFFFVRIAIKTTY